MNLILCVFMCVVFKTGFSLQPCEEHKTCDPCIRDSRECVWCSIEEKHIGPRCILEKSMTRDWCNNMTQNPENIKKNEKDFNFSAKLGNIVQLKPQRIKMKLRPGKWMEFNFKFKTAEHYPVDLYYLFDASESMEKRRNETAEQTEKLYRLMQKITNDVHLGLGTFVDKNALPFTDKKNSTSTYSFMHRLKLTDKYKNFKEMYKDIPYGDNFDRPEGGLDALAQAIVCNNIGWRQESRKIIIFVTDGIYHAAGDGKWAGIVEPYDGICYTENQRYTKELELDYPSIGIINKLASDREVKIIFLISTVKGTYIPLGRTIDGAQVISYDDVLNKKRVDTVLSEIYEEITRLIKLKVNIPSEYSEKIKLEFNPNCYDGHDDDKCKGKHGTPTEFVGKIKVSEFIEADNIKVDISIQGIKEKLTLDISLLSKCNCNSGNDSLCKGGGLRRCGVCECFADRHGEHCECSSSGDVVNQDKSLCIAPNSTIECSGRGVCICGSCTCEERYNGDYCECDKESCPRDKNGICGGHGDCYCGECICKKGWLKNTIKICNCPESNDQCQTGPNLCFGHSCVCGTCKCPPTTCEWDARSSQDSLCRPDPCSDCHSRQCQLLEPYALATTADSPCKNSINKTVIKNLTEWTEGGNWLRCENVRADVGCYTMFVYKYDDVQYGIHLIVQSESDCAESYYIYGGTCLGAIILIGVLTLVAWKILTQYRYRREYEQFCKSQGIEASLHTENPFFNEPSTTFNNPAFRKPSLTNF